MQQANELRGIKKLLRNLFAREDLDAAPVVAAPDRPRRRFVAALFLGEPLALDPERRPAPARAGASATTMPPGARPSFLRALFGRERLPEDPPAPRSPGRPGLGAALFAPEHLPELRAAAARPARSAWLRWLFRFEPLDPQ